MPPSERWKVCYYTPAEPPTHIATLLIKAPTPASALAAGNHYIREHHQANPAYLAATIEPDAELLMILNLIKLLNEQAK